MGDWGSWGVGELGSGGVEEWGITIKVPLLEIGCHLRERDFKLSPGLSVGFGVSN
ncbi:MAG: hypothetical protein F6K40_15115 [Okeania sp. SIO3I5]|uniref:hypothetical protein n=1 Tax=Okeania sp. SIO3I5 TaxID=2607805 RepID=UPI0013BC3947|nr:hypothetical protein [Okeania sp. SIO3I5]NEQ37528.1 hypothetical protein [Okeania sp. SIO3I5]